MRTIHPWRSILTFGGLVALAALISAAQTQPKAQNDSSAAVKAIHERLVEVQRAAESLDADKVFSFVLENNRGALVQNGNLLLTRSEALESTKRGFENLEKVHYQISQEHITMLAPTTALVVAEGSSSAGAKDGREFSTRFAQSVLLVLTNGEWKVFHAHRSFPVSR